MKNKNQSQGQSQKPANSRNRGSERNANFRPHRGQNEKTANNPNRPEEAGQAEDSRSTIDHQGSPEFAPGEWRSTAPGVYPSTTTAGDHRNYSQFGGNRLDESTSRRWLERRDAGHSYGTAYGTGFNKVDYETNYGPGYPEGRPAAAHSHHHPATHGHGFFERAGEWITEKVGQFTGKGPKGYQRSDARIHEDVCEALSRNSHLDASEIEVKVSDREVTLTGTVDARVAKRMAEDLAAEVSGVRDVHNQIRVASAGSTAQHQRPAQNRGKANPS